MKKIVIGNWKMNPASLKEAENLFNSVAKSVARAKKTDIVICPPFLYIEKLKKFSRKIILGAQDAYGKDVGAFTGEVSPTMLYNLGVRYVILGHSERRALGEENEEINKKIKASLSVGLLPILCVGESERDENHSYFNFVKTQLEVCLTGISKNAISKIIIAYEPVWAISSTPDRRDASASDSLEMAIYIRKVLADRFGNDAHKVRIIYGGSVNEKDALEFLKHGGVDGLLPGRASLDAKKFTEIIKICETLS
ncbi:MAG: triose-phosphate isomerase [Candidatus Parcubacteria bacterium]|nr:triose-phosphate isomerase [Candidatus Parcubacteria bacterium]